MTARIRVVIADDVLSMRLLLRRILLPSEGFEIVAEAEQGEQLVELVRRNQPDLVVTDVDMPVMDGLEATRKIVAQSPVPIVVFTSSTISTRRAVPIRALAAGAADVISKPELKDSKELARFAESFRARLRTLLSVLKTPGSASAAHSSVKTTTGCRLVVIGASTGGPSVLRELLSQLPTHHRASVVVVQHIDAPFVPGMVEWLTQTAANPIKVAVQGDHLRPSTIYVAPGGKHLLLEADTLQLRDTPPVNSVKPSIDVLFESIPRRIAPRVIAVLLTGIGRDGATGLQTLHQRGAMTIAQSEASCAVWGMPRVAIELGAARHILDPARIADFLKRSLEA